MKNIKEKLDKERSIVYYDLTDSVNTMDSDTLVLQGDINVLTGMLDDNIKVYGDSNSIVIFNDLELVKGSITTKTIFKKIYLGIVKKFQDGIICNTDIVEFNLKTVNFDSYDFLNCNLIVNLNKFIEKDNSFIHVGNEEIDFNDYSKKLELK